MLICRGCGATVTETFVDLGVQPLSNAYVRPERASDPESFYPLHPRVCEHCFLVQLGVFQPPEQIFSDYAYFSSFSTSWLEHSHAHAREAMRRLDLDRSSFVVEIASNDGYLLKSFVEAGIRVLGIEPAANVAEVARENGVPTEVAFFGSSTAASITSANGHATLMIANNVLAHVPDIHDFLEGFRIMLSPSGIATFEFPHLVPLIEQTQFDTIYHEHFSYLSLLALEPIFDAHGLHVVDAERLATHGGSLRLWVAHTDSSHAVQTAVEDLRRLERDAGLDNLATYRGFADQVKAVKNGLLRFLLDANDSERTVVAYGAAAKGNTLLNYCGIKQDLIDFVVDRNPHKQGLLLPGSRLHVRPISEVFVRKPEYLLVLPWNLFEEVSAQMAEIREWGSRFVVAIPQLTILK